MKKFVHFSMKNSNYIIYVVVLFLSFSFGCGFEEVINEVGNYKDGKKDGKWTSWYDDGQKWSERIWKDGELISGKYWDEDGNSCECNVYDDGRIDLNGCK